MAYGVKFRLEFSDDNLKGKKVEILKDGYTGSVLDLIGTDNPVEIDWNQDDDFYNPIIGSTCTLNLFDTDTTNYDDFYEADEREYKIKISYKDSSNNYQTYWEGWLLVDQFREAVTHKPFAITLKGYDGLGSLNGFTQPLSGATFLTAITNILANINLGLDVYVSNDIQRDSPISGYNVFDQVSFSAKQFFKSGVDPRNCKEVLEQILKFTNSRIFQSYGRWYLINNSSYSEQSVKDSSATTANSGTIPTGIRAAETSSLQTNNDEDVKFQIYNSSGVFQSESTVNVLHSVPTNLQPIGNNLTKEYIRPLKEYIQEVDMDGFFDSNIIQNPGFEFGSTSWTLTNSSIVSDFSFQGDKSLKSTNIKTSEGATGVTAELANFIDTAGVDHIAFKLKLNNFFKSTNTVARGFRFQLKLIAVVIPGDPAVADRYWSNSSNAWITSNTVNTVDVVTNNRWKSYDFNIASLPNGNWQLYFYLYDPFQNGTTTGFTDCHWDSIILEQQYIDDNNNRTDLFEKFDFLQFIRRRTGNFTGVKKLDKIILTNGQYGKIFGNFFRSRDKTNYLKSLEEITTQQVLNDFRNFVIRYEGDLYNNSNDPIGLHNKAWINFGTTVLQEPVSCYIDGMTYNVKRNIYSMIMHVPNQDDDLTSDFIVKF
tara:strand:+ start:5092 stop:7047 length:1956 start_codon:yes stop_codon:yes gene_type:complete